MKMDKERQVPVYKTITEYKEEPVYKSVKVKKDIVVEDYETITVAYTETQWVSQKVVGNTMVSLSNDAGGTIFVDGNIVRLSGKVNGRITLVSTGGVRINGNLQYVDGGGNTVMKNGDDYTATYERNSEYLGKTVLGVIARGDVVYTHTMPSKAEINGTLMSVEGRVGVDGFWSDENGELVKDSWRARKKLLTEEQRRIGGAISNNRIMSTYIRSRSDGTTYVDAGFKRGSMHYDINMLFNPPPNFVVIPRPVLTNFAPVFFVRNHD